MAGLLKAGQKLRNGLIEVIDQLGGGGLGEVYRVSYLKDAEQQVMVLKCFQAKGLEPSGMEAIEMVHRESTAISKIHHPGIVRIELVELDMKLPFILEEYLPFGDLGQLLENRLRSVSAKQAKCSSQEIAHIGLQISSALMVLHQNNLYHGDLKPHNLCLRDREKLEVVIVDFGHAGFLEGNLLDRNQNLATLAYLPPERTGFVKLAGNASGDLYSLGATLFEMASGQAPFTGNDNRDLINRLLYEVPKPLHQIFPDFPIVLSDIVSKLLRKDPKDRYHSAFGLAADLERCFLALKQGEEIPAFALGTKDKLRELNYRIPMVGRTQEMQTLHLLFDSVLGGGSQMALIGAPSGTGKSRLAFEILHSARQNNSLINYVKFSEYERNLPLSAVTLLLVEHCHYLKGISVERLIQWQKKLKDRLGSRLHLIADRYSFYAPFLPLTELSQIPQGELGFQLFNQTLGEFLSLLPAQGERQLLLIDDLQWADWQSLQVLAMLANRIISQEAQGTMFMGTYRSNEIGADHPLVPSLLALRSQFDLIELGPLTRSESDTLVEHLLDEKGTEVQMLQDVCYRFTAGNPFYVYEYLKTAIHTEIFALDSETQTWRFHEEKTHESDLSTGVAGLVADRILALNPLQQTLVGISSVAGHSMKRSVLKHLIPLLISSRQLVSEQLLVEDLDLAIELSYQELLQKNILSPDLERFAFFHDKIQEACYSLLGDDEKKTLHYHFGLWCVSAIEDAEQKTNDAELFEAAYHICLGQRQDLSSSVRSFLITAAKAARRVYAYDRAKEYLQTLLEALEAQPETALQEKFDALELMADVLTISDQIHEAIKLYDKLLLFDCDPLRRVHIYAKKVEFSLNLFEYKQARESCVAALDVLGARIISREWVAYLYIAVTLPFMLLYCLYFKFFGKQTKEVTDELENIRLQLLIKSQISLYFSQPIIAIANNIPLTFKLLSYKDNSFRATLICYWGIGAGAFGLKGFSSQCFSQAYDYFDKTANPVDKGFVLFAWAFTSDFPRGNLVQTQKKLEEALLNLAPVGESFWRSISILGLLLLDYFGAESGQAAIRSHELVELWKKVRYAATPLGCALRHYLEDANLEQTNFIVEHLFRADQHIQGQGYDSVDSVFAMLGLGEYFEFIGDHQQAEHYAKRAFRISCLRVHRVVYALFSPLVYTRVLTSNKKYKLAFFTLLFAWLNQLLLVRIFHPQTCYETGRWLHAIGWKRLGRSLVERGMRFASKRGWLTPLAEGRLLLAHMLGPNDPDLALAYLHMAREHFSQRRWKFHESLCDKELNRQKLARMEKSAATNDSKNITIATKRGTALRQQIEVQALMDVLLKLSAINDREPLFKALMESLCHATGSELALLYFQVDGRWQAAFAHNIQLEQSDLFKTKVDQSFIHHALHLKSIEPCIRKSQDLSRPTTTGSALLLPLVAEAKIHGFCYLANTQLYDLFDRRSIDVARPIAMQGAIALQNIQLHEQLAVEKDRIVGLNQTLELRVIEQTRDIKSIMQHIEMGICTVSGRGILINKDYSLFLEQLFGVNNLHGQDLIPLLLSYTGLSADEIDQAKQALHASIDESELAFDMNAHLLPIQLNGHRPDHSSFYYELNWIPICDDLHKVERILLTINDVTELRGLQAKADQRAQELHIISEILNRSEREWSQFISNSKSLLQKCQDQIQSAEDGEEIPTVLKKIFIYLHTIKGNARSLGFRHMNDVIHGIEQYFADRIKDGTSDLDRVALQQKVVPIEAVMKAYESIASQKLGRIQGREEAISLQRDPLLHVYHHLQELTDQGEALNPSLQDALHSMRQALFISLRSLIGDLFKELEPLALELGKGIPKAQVDLPELWVDRKTERLLRNCFVHLLRNSLYHGLQSQTEREVKQLPPQGTISISARIRGRMVDFFIEDDGRGLNIDRLRLLGLQKGLISSDGARDAKTVAGLVFQSDVSTAEEINDVSGRGIGMAAVLDTLREVGASIDIRLLRNRTLEEGYAPFLFVISVPLDLFSSDSSRQAA